jgi:mycothiol synthase
MFPSPTSDAGGARAPIAIRPMQNADLDAVVALINAADAVDQSDEGTSAAEFCEWVDDTLGTLDHFVAVAPDGTIAGYGDVHHRSGDEGAWGWVVVHPAWRQRGIGRLLADRMVERAQRLGALWIDYAVDSRLHPATDWLTHLGYEPVRNYLRLRLPCPAPVAAPTYPPGFRVRTFEAGRDEAAVHRIIHPSFTDHHNVNEISMEHLEQHMHVHGFDPRGLFLAETPEGVVAGLCWCVINTDENTRRGERVGWINDLGTLRPYRRLGLGRALLLEGIGWLHAEGVAAVELWVDGSNTPARALYADVGFTVSKALTDFRHFLFVPRRSS